MDKMKMKKAWIVLLLMGLLLAACSPSAATQAADGANPSSPTEAAKDGAVYPAPSEGAEAAGTQGYPAPADSGAPAGDAGYPGPAANGGLVQLSLPDGSSVSLAPTDLTGLSAVEITADGQSKTGYRLSDLLTAYNVSQYQTLTAQGPNASITLSPDQIDDQTILEMASDGSVNLVMGKLPAAQWIVPVTTIEVK